MREIDTAYSHIIDIERLGAMDRRKAMFSKKKGRAYKLISDGEMISYNFVAVSSQFFEATPSKSSKISLTLSDDIFFRFENTAVMNAWCFDLMADDGGSILAKRFKSVSRTAYSVGR